MDFERNAGRVLRIGDNAQLQLCNIFLLFIDDIIKQARRPAHADRQYARRVRVERAAVTDARAPGQTPLDKGHQIARAHPRRFEHIQKSVQMRISLSC